jgi:hypothetical protein
MGRPKTEVNQGCRDDLLAALVRYTGTEGFELSKIVFAL